MNIDYWVKVATIAGSLLQGVCWPVVVLVIFLYYRRTLKSLIEDAREVSVKASVSGVEATVSRRVSEASAYLGAAEAHRAAEAPSDAGRDVGTVQDIASTVSRVVTPQVVGRLSSATVLWVDDRPSNNTYERRSLEAVGIQVEIATSTEEALTLVQQRSFGAIITDMSRPPDDRAGYTLLTALQDLMVKTPVIIYTGSNRPEQRAEARRRGAFGSTNDPRELFQLVVTAIVQSPR